MKLSLKIDKNTWVWGDYNPRQGNFLLITIVTSKSLKWNNIIKQVSALSEWSFEAVKNLDATY
jgi:hypothetical protein